MRSVVAGAFVTIALIALTGLIGGVVDIDFASVGSTHPKESVCVVVLLLVGWGIAYVAGRSDQRAVARELKMDNNRLESDLEELEQRFNELAVVGEEAKRLRGIIASKKIEGEA